MAKKVGKKWAEKWAEDDFGTFRGDVFTKNSQNGQKKWPFAHF